MTLRPGGALPAARSAFRDAPGGCTVRVRVRPGSSRPGIRGGLGDRLVVAVSASPERGRANEALVALLAEALARPRRDLAILEGRTARDKVVAVAGLSAAEASRRLSGTSAEPA